MMLFCCVVIILLAATSGNAVGTPKKPPTPTPSPRTPPRNPCATAPANARQSFCFNHYDLHSKATKIWTKKVQFIRGEKTPTCFPPDSFQLACCDTRKLITADPKQKLSDASFKVTLASFQVAC